MADWLGWIEQLGCINKGTNMKVITALLLFFASLLFAVTALMQAVMEHWIYAIAAIVAATLLAVLSGKVASAT